MSTGARQTMVPDVLDALVAMFGAAAPSATQRLPSLNGDGTVQEVAVIDGEPTTNLPPTYVLVGYSATFASAAFSGSSGLAVEGQRTETELPNRQFGESFTVWCEISSAVGDTDPAVPKRMRRAVGDIYSACVSAIDGDPTLQGTVQQPAYAQVTTFRWLLDQSTEGYAATVQFAVSIIGDMLVPA